MTVGGFSKNRGRLPDLVAVFVQPYEPGWPRPERLKKVALWPIVVLVLAQNRFGQPGDPSLTEADSPDLAGTSGLLGAAAGKKQRSGPKRKTRAYAACLLQVSCQPTPGFAPIPTDVFNK